MLRKKNTSLHIAKYSFMATQKLHLLLGTNVVVINSASVTLFDVTLQCEMTSVGKLLTQQI